MPELLLHVGNNTMNNKGWVDLHPPGAFSPHFRYIQTGSDIHYSCMTLGKSLKLSLPYFQ